MVDSETSTIRRVILFSGRVQGVGFRFTVQAAATPFDVTGFVRNLPDGRVELVAEASRAELDRFQQSIMEAMRSNIAETVAHDTPATGEFPSFTIAF